MLYNPSYVKNPAQTELQRYVIIKIMQFDILYKDSSWCVLGETWHIYNPCLLEPAHFSR